MWKLARQAKSFFPSQPRLLFSFHPLALIPPFIGDAFETSAIQTLGLMIELGLLAGLASSVPLV